MTFTQQYHSFITQTMELVHTKNLEAMEQAAQCLYSCEKAGGSIYTFGTGHSHMIGQDLYARAGGYAKIYPIVEIELTLATHPVKSTHIERCSAYADVLEVLYPLQSKDTLIITSNSGRNALIIEYALRAKALGCNIIAITSLQHSKSIQSRHESGLRLFEIADVVLDNMAPCGDAGVAIDENTIMGPVSTLSGCYLAQCVIGRFVELLKEHDMEAPVFRSSNLDGSDAYNAELFTRYVIPSRKK